MPDFVDPLPEYPTSPTEELTVDETYLQLGLRRWFVGGVIAAVLFGLAIVAQYSVKVERRFCMCTCCGDYPFSRPPTPPPGFVSWDQEIIMVTCFGRTLSVDKFSLSDETAFRWIVTIWAGLSLTALITCGIGYGRTRWRLMRLCSLTWSSITK
jgi:hypothetical protein